MKSAVCIERPFGRLTGRNASWLRARFPGLRAGSAAHKLRIAAPAKISPRQSSGLSGREATAIATAPKPFPNILAPYSPIKVEAACPHQFAPPSTSLIATRSENGVVACQEAVEHGAGRNVSMDIVHVHTL